MTSANAMIVVPRRRAHNRRSDLVEKCIQIMQSSSLPPAEVALSVLEEAWSALDDAVKLDLAVAGLGHAAAYVYANRRILPKPSDDQKAEIIRATKRMGQKVGRSIGDHASEVLRSISLYIGGKLRSLFAFTAADLAEFLSDCRAHAHAWTSRVDWGEMALTALSRARVKSLGELPPVVLVAVAKKAEQTWSHEEKKLHATKTRGLKLVEKKRGRRAA